MTKRLFYPFVTFFFFLFVSNTPAYSAEDIEMINRPVNTSGLTGLLFTTSPFTVPVRTVEIGGSVISEKSTTPAYTLTEFPLSVTIGIADNMELAVRGSYIQRDTAPSLVDRGSGDAEISYKWNFKPQAEYSNVPAVALFVTGIAPTGDRGKDLNRVHSWGTRFGLSAGSEISFDEHVLGLYADAQLVLQDVTTPTYRDIYSVVNAGALFPISKYRNLQIFIEYTMVNGKKIVNVDGLDFSATTYGLRLVSERFNLSLGTQFIRKEQEGFDKSSRLIGMVSMKF